MTDHPEGRRKRTGNDGQNHADAAALTIALRPPSRHRDDVTELAAQIRAGDRNALARAITLVESRRDADVAAAEALLQTLLPHTGGSLRIGITGAPGVGKST